MKLSEALKKGIAEYVGFGDNAVVKRHINVNNSLALFGQIQELEVDIAIDGSLDTCHSDIRKVIVSQPINGSLYCHSKELEELIISQPIGGSVYCCYSGLKELNITHRIGCSLYCNSNRLKKLTISQPIGGAVYCNYNELTELTITQPIGSSLICSGNKLTELNILQPIGGSVDCHGNQLTELTISHPIGRILEYTDNPLTKVTILAPIGSTPYCADTLLKEAPKYEILKNGQRGEDWIYTDNILSHFHKIRKMHDITFYIGFKCTVVEHNGNYAHGEDMRSALFDLRFKLMDLDKSAYMNLTLESKLTYEEAIIMYRVITGACRAGTSVFLDYHPELSKDKIYTVREIIAITEGQYGNNSLREFYKLLEK
jgi:hypothetical protein